MKHLIISREYPPAPYAPGGIGTYVANVARLMAERGETVLVIGQRWDGAPKPCETAYGGRLIVHRIGESDLPQSASADAERLMRELDGLKKTVFPNQCFAFHAALLAERLIEDEAVDVVEGQDWEAPLYYLLLRRALGLGPRRCPPCVVHLHSPTEFERHFNGKLSGRPEYLVMKRLEDFCIHAADALLCPSRYLASQCIDLYGLPPERIKVIPYPVGFTPVVQRDRRIWEQGNICYVGRLEPRKGIIEWLKAAAQVAGEDSAVCFDIVGADTWRLKDTLLRRMPRKLRPRFRFHGSRPRAELPRFLARARAGVVPSRWENFPNVCIEAMSSGLPVIATRLGGMVELLEDGRTGWLAPETGIAGMVDGLADALRRCLAASADQRASMGGAAAEAVRERCNNERTVDEHIAFRADVVRLGAHRSVTLSGLSRPRSGEPAQGNLVSPSGCKGAGIIVKVEEFADAAPVLRSIRNQTSPPRAVVVVSGAASRDAVGLRRPAVAGAAAVLVHSPATGAEAWNAGLAAATVECGYWLFLDQRDRLLPDCLVQIERVLARRPEVGIVSFWTDRIGGSGSIEAQPCPDFPYQLTGNDVTSASAFRAEAVAVRPFRPGMPRDYDIWDVANTAMARGWSAVTYPGLLAQRTARKPGVPWPEATALRAMRAELLRQFSDVLAPASLHLIENYVPIPLAMHDGGATLGEPRHEWLAHRLLTAMFHPVTASRAVIRRIRAVPLRVPRMPRLRRAGPHARSLPHRAHQAPEP